MQARLKKKKFLIQANCTSIYKWILRAQFRICVRGELGSMG